MQRNIAFIILFLSIQLLASYFPIHAQTLVKSIPMEIKAYRNINTWQINNAQQREIIWIWEKKSVGATTFDITVKRMNYSFEVIEEFSDVIPASLYERLLGSWYDTERDEYTCLFSKLRTTGCQQVMLDFKQKKVKLKHHGFHEDEQPLGQVAEVNSFSFFSLLHNTIIVREFREGKLRQANFTIKELPQKNTVWHGLSRFTPLNATLVPSQGLRYPMIANPLVKLYKYQERYYLTINEPKAGKGTVFIELDVAKNSYTYHEVQPKKISKARKSKMNSFFHGGRLFTVIANQYAAYIQIRDISNKFEIVKEYRINMQDDFPFPKSPITKGQFSLTRDNFGSSSPYADNYNYNIKKNRNTQKLISKMRNKLPLIVLGDMGKDTLSLLVGSYKLYDHNFFTYGSGNLQFKTVYFQSLLDAKELTVIKEEYDKQYQGIGGGIVLNLMTELNSSSLEDFEMLATFAQKIERHILMIQAQKFFFYPQVILRTVIDGQLYYGYYRKDLKEIQILKF